MAVFNSRRRGSTIQKWETIPAEGFIVDSLKIHRAELIGSQ
jgi:hypothetical protein